MNLALRAGLALAPLLDSAGLSICRQYQIRLGYPVSAQLAILRICCSTADTALGVPRSS
jgi:hypothetical protein